MRKSTASRRVLERPYGVFLPHHVGESAWSPAKVQNASINGADQGIVRRLRHATLYGGGARRMGDFLEEMAISSAELTQGAIAPQPSHAAAQADTSLTAL